MYFFDVYVNARYSIIADEGLLSSHLRSYVYRFIETFAPPLTRDVVQDAMRGLGGVISPDYSY